MKEQISDINQIKLNTHTPHITYNYGFSLSKSYCEVVEVFLCTLLKLTINMYVIDC